MELVTNLLRTKATRGSRCVAMHRFSVQRRRGGRGEFRNTACGKRNSGASASGLESVSPTGDGLHVSAAIVELGAASEKHDAELFEERLEASGFVLVNRWGDGRFL